MAIDHLRAPARDPISGTASDGYTLSYAAPPRAPANTSASVAAHAALFDGVAARHGRRTSDIPLDATRQAPARRASFAWFDNWLEGQRLAGNLDGAAALDLGCGRGEVSVQMALAGATVTGIDVSRESVTGNAEAISFDDNSFDLAVCAGLMSFVDFERTAAELSRVTRPGGTVVILDTLGHNPIARMGRKRRLVHGETTHFQVENIMTCDHIDRLRAHFGSVEVNTFDLLTVPMIVLENGLGRIHPRLRDIFAPVSAVLRALDSVVLKWRPLRRYAFRTAIVLKWPRLHERG